jgi:hypothetical protein
MNSSQTLKKNPGLAKELASFLGHNKKWYLLPILLALLLMSVFLILGSTAAAPFIYSLF